MIRAVLFDLDGVIRHFDPQHLTLIERRHGIEAGVINGVAFSSPVIEQVTTGRISRSEWIAHIAAHLDNEEAASEWGRQPFKIDQVLVEIAEEIRSTGRATAILTNGTGTIGKETTAAGLHSHFDPIFNSADIGYAKPDERAFQHVLEELDLAADELFFTDDSLTKLVGTALGIATHHFLDAAGLRAALRDHGVPVDSKRSTAS